MSTWLSGVRSATTRFNRPFSSASWRRRRASLTSRPGYFAFHREYDFSLMPWRRHEQIAMALRQAEAGTPVGEICRKLGVSVPLLRILYFGMIQGGVGAEREQMTFGSRGEGRLLQFLHRPLSAWPSTTLRGTVPPHNPAAIAREDR